VGYWSLVGLVDRTWFDADHVVPPTRQLITLLSLALTGIVMGQIVRQVRGIASDYAERVAVAEKTV